MKKIIVILGGCFSLVNCTKKDYNCSCTVNGSDYSKTISKTTKTDANSKCSDYGKSIGQSVYSGNYTYTCKVN